MFKTMSLKAAANPMIIAGMSAAQAAAADHTFVSIQETMRTAVFWLTAAMSQRGHHLQGYQFYGWELGGTTTQIKYLLS